MGFYDFKILRDFFVLVGGGGGGGQIAIIQKTCRNKVQIAEESTR